MSPLAMQIMDQLREQSRHFAEVVELHMDVPWPEFLRAWGEVRVSPLIGREDDGLYTVRAGETIA